MDKFSERINIYMRQTGMTQADILEKCSPFCEKFNVKLNKSTLSLYVSGARTPKLNKLKVFECALGVSAEWLIGYTDDPVPHKTDHASGIEALFLMLNDTGKQKAIDYISDLLENSKYRKEEAE